MQTVVLRDEGSDLARTLAHLEATQDVIGYDTETCGWSPGETPVGRALVVCFSVASETVSACVDGRLLHKFRQFLEDPQRRKIVANQKFEQHVSANHGICLRGVELDTVLASFTLNPDREGRHGVKEAAQDHLGVSMDTFSTIVPDHDVWRAWHMEPDRLAKYAVEDAQRERELGLVLRRKLQNKTMGDSTAWDYYARYQAPYNDILFQMERIGVQIDQEKLEAAQQAIRKALSRSEYEIARIIGRPLRMSAASFVGSSKTLAQYLYRERGLTAPLTTKGWCCGVCDRTISKDAGLPNSGGRPDKRCPEHPSAPVIRTKSTSKAALEVLARTDTFCAEVLNHRHLKKSAEQVENILRSVQSTGRVYTTYRQFGARTGRLSSATPNLQNLLSSSRDAFHLRQAFVADKGKGISDADYNQLEYRLLAHLSGEQSLIEGFRVNSDYHSMTAKSMFRLPCAVGDVKDRFPAERKRAKNGNFCINYGGRPAKLALSLGCSLVEAQKFIEEHSVAFPGVHAWWDRQKRFAREHGYVETLLGWQRPTPGICSEQDWVREAAERISINTPVQGGAADVIRGAMLRLSNSSGFENVHAERLTSLGVTMHLQVHDELVLQVPDGAEREAEDCIRTLMEHPLTDCNLSVSLPCEILWGRTWGDAK